MSQTIQDSTLDYRDKAGQILHRRRVSAEIRDGTNGHQRRVGEQRSTTYMNGPIGIKPAKRGNQML